MTTPSETMAGKLPLRAAAEKARDVLRSIIRDKSGGVHYAAAQTACHQINEALAASEPVEAVGYVDGDGRAVWYTDNFHFLQPKAGTELYTHPAPEQPGKGEECPVCDGTGRQGGEGSDMPCENCDAKGYTPQPSDPAEGDAVRKALIAVRDRFFPADQPERLRDLLWDEVNTALSTPPTAAVSVASVCGTPIREIVKRLTAMRASTSGLSLDELITLELAEAALTAALDPQVKR